jgi:hypothetical protein
MPFAGDGTFSLVYNFSVEALAPPLEIAKLDEEFTGISAGLSGCLLRNGTGLPTTDIPWNNQKITGLGDATAATHAMNRQASDARYAQLAAANTFSGTVRINQGSEAIKLVPASDPGIHYIHWMLADGNTERAYVGFGAASNTFHIANAVSGAAIDFVTTGGGALTLNGVAVLTANSGLAAANLTGTIADARFPATLPAVSGANLTNLPAANLTGNIADARVPASAVTQHQASILAGKAKVPVSSTSGTLVAGDAWTCVDITADIAVPNSTFTAGDIVTIYNNSSTAKNITRAAGTQYKAGTDGDDASIAIAPRGFATIRFRTATEWTVSGQVS